MNSKLLIARMTCTAAATILSCLAAESGWSATLNLADAPLFLSANVPPLNMLVIGRDHKLYYEAYNDASDLDNDGVVDVGYKPDRITYFGYFDSLKCYSYVGDTFTPVSTTANKKCSGNWSGDFLNYLTTARLDALRKVLYGGSRYVDSATDTVLQRTHIPQDAHSWGKEYESVAHDGYSISDYAPLGLPDAGKRHLFANTTLLNDASQLPRLRVLQNMTNHIWEWVSIERPVAGNNVLTNGVNTAVTPTDYTVRVRVCAAGLEEENCRAYPAGSAKPIGLLQEYGENDSMLFGLLTGSYQKNTSGGVLRKRVGSITDEIDLNTGQFLNVTGILSTLDRFRTVGFGGSYEYSCGWITTRPINEGECRMWGNPTAEMMYETLRYFAGKGVPRPEFMTTGGDDAALGLPAPSWDDPYQTASSCAKPFETVISDINPSYDSDQLPGSKWGGIAGDIPGGLDVRSLGNQIWNQEYGGSSMHFIGEADTADGAPTPKLVTGFGEIRGLAPEEPTKRGSYYAASIAYQGLKTDLNAAAGAQKVQTFAVALASPLPRIEIPVGAQVVTLVPFAKSVGGLSINAAQGQFQPTNQIVDFYVESMGPTNGRFRVNFEDVEQGADHDMDAIAIYQYTVNGDSVDVEVTSEYAFGGIKQHIGYVISGTTADGTYLVVRDLLDSDPPATSRGDGNPASSDPNYFLDTPNDTNPMPLYSKRTFYPGAATAATLLKDPLWYAAKWGGFKDGNGNGLPDVQSEWDEDPVGSPGYGTPDNYFLVTNALTLGAQLSKAFDDILGRVASASSASVNSAAINSDTRLFQAKFSSTDWSGDLISQRVQGDGSLAATGAWSAAGVLPAADARQVITVNSAGTGVPFRWASLDATRQAALQPSDTAGSDRLEYLRGDRSKELKNGGLFRDRSTALGDIIDSAPAFVGRPPYLYQDSLESAPYSAFQQAQNDREPAVYVGGNDGMLHAFQAETGEELLAFIPGTVFTNLHQLTRPNYSHRYYVDGSPMTGDVFYGGQWHTALVAGLNKGGQGVYALDVTNPAAFSEGAADDLFLWEFTDANDADLGYTFSRPTIVRMHNGRWVAVFGNGYDNTFADGRASTTGNAVLYVVDVQTGSLVRKIDTGSGMSADPTGLGRPNGLATPVLVDVDGDSIVDLAYAGDLFGNVWKFALANANANNWDVAFRPGGVPTPLLVARDSTGRPQPITSRPNVSRGPDGRGLFVVFGTGKYLEPSDENLTNLTPQTFYGVHDANTGTDADMIAGRGELTQQEILAEVSVPSGADTVDARVTTDNPIGSHRGWYMDLVSPTNGFEGEMQVYDAVIRNGRVMFTTLIPNPDQCSDGGRSWYMDVDLFSGARLDYAPLDVNGDGSFDSDDYVEVVLADGTTITVPVSGVETTVGIAPKPAILTTNQSTALRDLDLDGDIDDDDRAILDQLLNSPPYDEVILNGSSGSVETLRRNPGPSATGRQSWRQVR